MEDLIYTVRQRYASRVSYMNLSTLTYRTSIKQAPGKSVVEEKVKGKGFFDFIRPQLSGVSQRIHAEISKLLERREKTMLQTVTREIPRLISRQAQQWKTDGARSEKTRLESVRRIDKRVDLVAANTKMGINAVRREIEKMKEQAKRRERAYIPKEELPITHRAANRIALEYAARERTELRREISASAVKTEQRIARKIREEEEYQKRRRG